MLRGLKLLALNLVCINLTLLLATVGSYLVSWYLGIAASVLAAIGLVVGAARSRQPSLFYAALIAMIGGVLCGMSASDLRQASRGETLRGVTLAEAIGHPEAAAFTFSDAQVRGPLRGSHYSTGGTRGARSGRYHHAAPIVETSWRQGDPVQAWAVCGEVAACLKSWESPWRAALNLNRETEHLPSYRGAARAAEASFGIASHPHALFVRWVASPESALAEERWTLWMTALFWNLAWLLPWLLWRLIARLRGRRLTQN